MSYPFVLSPRYRLDDESIWLEGIDPSRHYWIRMNGDPQQMAIVPGVLLSSEVELRGVIQRFRALKSFDRLEVERVAGTVTIECINENCYAIVATVNDAPVWHLFDRETLEMLLRSSHPDWIPSPKDIELGRKSLNLLLNQAEFSRV